MTAENGVQNPSSARSPIAVSNVSWVTARTPLALATASSVSRPSTARSVCCPESRLGRPASEHGCVDRHVEIAHGQL